MFQIDELTREADEDMKEDQGKCNIIPDHQWLLYLAGEMSGKSNDEIELEKYETLKGKSLDLRKVKNSKLDYTHSVPY